MINKEFKFYKQIYLTFSLTVALLYGLFIFLRENIIKITKFGDIFILNVLIKFLQF